MREKGKFIAKLNRPRSYLVGTEDGAGIQWNWWHVMAA